MANQHISIGRGACLGARLAPTKADCCGFHKRWLHFPRTRMRGHVRLGSMMHVLHRHQIVCSISAALPRA